MRLLVALLAFLLAATSWAQASPAQAEARRIVASLERDNAKYLFDMHGNADGRLQRLMILRFDATPAVQSGIDRMRGDPRRTEVVEALYHVLGFVKDPASIPWLETKLATLPRTIHANYLTNWAYPGRFVIANSDGIGNWPWLTGHQRWTSFFIAAHAAATNPDRRLDLTRILKGFDDATVMAFFQSRRKASTDPREILLVEAYLHQHNVPADGKRIAAAVHTLRKDSDNRELLLGTADALRDPAFVPYLIDTYQVAEKHIYPASYPSQDLLQSITFEMDLDGRAAWKAWYEQHRGESRAQWAATATTAFKQRLARDPASAREWFGKAIYRWNDIEMLPLVRTELLPRPEFRSNVAGWINLTYSAHLRPRLRPLAEELAKHSPDLEDWAKNLMIERGFIGGRKPETWEQYVRSSNSRV